MKRKIMIPVAVGVVAIVAMGAYLLIGEHENRGRGVEIYGNIDIRQVELAFNDAGRIQHLDVEEGASVHPGELLAQLNAARYADAVERAQGQMRQQRQLLAKLLAGSRPEEIVAARARVAGAEADWRNAVINYHRARVLYRRHYVSRESVDDARRTLDATAASLREARQAWILAVKGPRKEDIAEARAALQADEAALALARRELADTRLYATAPGVVEDRILEVGDMATPGTPVFTIALNNPVWARAYLPETRLARVAPGMRAYIENKDLPGRRYVGWVGYVSPTAEFTPKTVETTELRSQLVYTVRVYACNPTGALRLGMPVTVLIPPQSGSVPLPAHPCRS
ncbi:efflux RND transporter periplasmic adaptor subunit [Acidiferrobacter sp.]|uniref:efflux RND transporter periplasmic adaptor subunit n=1 Tax=Acidiferrobacter sp. TaxID=1872107 RepID=UPI0026300285|nr:efflux RND transporter periplasmic adaptor subunit [Acidiferrobacter sp.]